MLSAKMWFGLGMLAGAAVGAAFVYRKAKEDAMKAASEEIEAYKEAFNKSKVSTPEKPQDRVEGALNPLQTPLTKPAASALVREFASRRPDLASEVEHNITDANEATEVVREAYVHGGEIPNINVLPTVISLQEWSTGGGFEDVELVYYEEDEVLLIVDDDEIVENIEDLVGDALTRFGQTDPGDEDLVIVRNFSMLTDYSIARVHSSYHSHHGL